MFRTNWLISKYNLLKQPFFQKKDIVNIQNEINKFSFNKNIKMSTNLTSFIDTSYIEYNDIINQKITKKNLTRAVIFINKFYILQKFINDFSKVIGMFHTIPIHKDVYKTARLHRNLEEYFNNVSNIWRYKGFYINLKNVNWKQFVPLNIDNLNNASKIKFIIGILLEKLSYNNCFPIISIHKVIRHPYIEKQIYLYGTIQDCFKTFLNNFYVDPSLTVDSYKSIHKILNNEDVIIKLDRDLLLYLEQYDAKLYELLHL